MLKEGRSNSDHDHLRSSPSWSERQLSRCQVVMVSTADLRPTDVLRSDGESSEHIQSIAESGSELPPIIVHEPTMRIIDGMHRLKAAMLRGEERIEAQLYKGSVIDAFVIAVQANIMHGLRLSLGDRVRAATRIVSSHPKWSDRAIASVVGLSPNTVAAIRRRCTVHPESPARVGRDGRIRPVSTAARRRLAGELMTRDPDASLRQIAKAVGLAPSTVMDVRARIRAGRDLVPDNQNTTPESRPAAPRRRRASIANDTDPGSVTIDRANGMKFLLRNPSLRFSEKGRLLLRWLETQPNAWADWRRIIDSVPERCFAVVLELARDNAKTWSAIVDRVERRAQPRLRPPAPDMSS
jgi:ParB-like chromosome segregation protein Spo0J